MYDGYVHGRAKIMNYVDYLKKKNPSQSMLFKLLGRQRVVFGTKQNLVYTQVLRR